VIDKMLADSVFGTLIDPGRIGAAGFSLGGYTMIEIAGGITDPSAFKAFCSSARADGICKSPPEFPDLLEQYDRLTKTDPDFQQALAHAGDSYREPRLRAVFAMAPALGPAFTAASLANDQNVPIASSARYFCRAHSWSETYHPSGRRRTLRLPGYVHGFSPQIFADSVRRCTRC
jgi:predicted dienelactone hydrolase